MYDKRDFPSYAHFLKAIGKGNQNDNLISIYNGVVDCIGVSQEQIDEEVEKEKKILEASRKKRASQNSMTCSPQDTDTH